MHSVSNENGSLILGLDISTSCIGICLYDGENIRLDNLQFKGCNSLFEKADKAREKIRELSKTEEITKIFVEEALIGFRPGSSSAQTITLLVKFNALVSFIARDELKIEPQFISAASARKSVGVHVQRVSKCGKSQKDQVFEHMQSNDLAGYSWPLKKSGKIVDWAKDATDAYVIARSGFLLSST
jgi:hypothetical protein